MNFMIHQKISVYAIKVSFYAFTGKVCIREQTIQIVLTNLAKTNTLQNFLWRDEGCNKPITALKVGL